jgi:hypothetical protein
MEGLLSPPRAHIAPSMAPSSMQRDQLAQQQRLLLERAQATRAQKPKFVEKVCMPEPYEETTTDNDSNNEQVYDKTGVGIGFQCNKAPAASPCMSHDKKGGSIGFHFNEAPITSPFMTCMKRAIDGKTMGNPRPPKQAKRDGMGMHTGGSQGGQAGDPIILEIEESHNEAAAKSLCEIFNLSRSDAMGLVEATAASKRGLSIPCPCPKVGLYQSQV